MNIIELAQKNNLIKELKDIDIVEDNSIYLNEEKSAYNFKYNAGDIVFVKKYNYNDGTNGSNHLFLIIEDNYIVSMDYFCLLISSQLDKLKYDTNLFLAKDNKNKLKKDSILKLYNIYRIENEDILFKVGEVAQEKAQEIDETCFVRYGDDDKAYTECVKNGLCQTTADIISKKSSISDEQFKEMNDHLEDLKSIVQNYKSDDVKRIYGMNVSNIKWLIDFIEIIKQRDNLDGVEQNVSIAYCSSFLPIMQKIKENQPKEPSPTYSPPDDLFDFEDNGWF